MLTKSILFPSWLAFAVMAGNACGSSSLLQQSERSSWQAASQAQSGGSVRLSLEESAQGGAVPRKGRALPPPSPRSAVPARDERQGQEKRATLPAVEIAVAPRKDTARAFAHSIAPRQTPSPVGDKIKIAQVGDITAPQQEQQSIAPLVFAQPPDHPAPWVHISEEASDSIPAQLLTAQMWDDLFPSRYGVALKGKNSASEVGGVDFFSYAAFVAACKRYPDFLNTGQPEQRKRELAAFLAHIHTETGGLRFSEQLNPRHAYCAEHSVYPPAEGRDYRGRGPIQLSYNYNYGQFSADYFGDKNVLLQRPEMLAEDSVASFASAVWFWMTPQSPKPSCHNVMTGVWQPQQRDLDANRMPGFGLTLNIINASQCGSNASAAALRRYETYERLCRYFAVERGGNCDCDSQQPYGK